MGFFGFGKKSEDGDEKKAGKTCPICHKAIGKFTYNPVKDGELCDTCAEEVKEWWAKPLTDATVDMCGTIIYKRDMSDEEKRAELDSVGGTKAYADIYSSIAFRYLDDDFTVRTMDEYGDNVLLDCVVMLGEFSVGDKVKFYHEGELFDGEIIECTTKDYDSFEEQCDLKKLTGEAEEGQPCWILVRTNPADAGEKLDYDDKVFI
jgi:hypothetical protein